MSIIDKERCTGETPVEQRDWNHLKKEYELYEGAVSCPFCGVNSWYVKTLGEGSYRCKGACKTTFMVLEYSYNDREQP